MTQKPAILGVILFILTMIIFFILYFISGVNYFDNSIKINAFLLPVLYCAFAFISVRSYWKKNRTITFREAFKRAFTTMFVGGFLSVLSIFVFLNFIDPAAKDLLNYQYVERQKTELTKEYESAKKILAKDQDIQDLDKKYKERMQSFAPEKVKDKDMLTASHFSAYFAAILIFYLILSIFFGAFFRSKSAY